MSPHTNPVSIRTRSHGHRSAREKFVLVIAAISTGFVFVCFASLLVFLGLEWWQHRHVTALSPSLAPAIVGTVMVTFVATLIVMPLGVVAAIYLSEFADRKAITVRALRVLIRNMAAMPPIVYGAFGLGFFVRFVGQVYDDVARTHTAILGRPNLLWAGCTFALLAMPVVIVTTEDALRKVPNSLREASLALGASPVYATIRVILPPARTGIFRAAVLAISQVTGEVTPLLVTGAIFSTNEPRVGLTEPFSHLGYTAFVLAERAESASGSNQLYSALIALLVVTLALNIVAIVLRHVHTDDSSG
jgi:phosphate transport system permease protein